MSYGTVFVGFCVLEALTLSNRNEEMKRRLCRLMNDPHILVLEFFGDSQTGCFRILCRKWDTASDHLAAR